MRCPSAIEDETGRLLALAQYGLDEEEVLPDLEPVVHIAARMFDTPVAAVNMIGSDHVFFAASTGIEACDMRRDVSFCAHAITQDDVMVVLDATRDARFHDNPLVTGNAGIRFYAGVPLRAPSGHALGALCVIDSNPKASFSEQDRERLRDLARLASDKLELHRLENAQQDGAFRFDQIAITSPTPVVCFDAEKHVTFWNAASTKLFGYSFADVAGRRLDALIPISEQPIFDMIDELIAAGQPMIGGGVRETVVIRKDGTSLPIEMSLFSWKQGGLQNFGAILTDVSGRHHHEEQLFRLSNFDQLTGVANRNLFHRRISEDLPTGFGFSIISVDIDNFKDVNGTLGVTLGDNVLCTVAERIRMCTRPMDTIARTAGDEFAVLLPHIDDETCALSFAEAMMTAIAKPIHLGSKEVRVTASCGVAISPTHGRDAEQLMSNAGLALSHAKERSGGGAFVFIPSLREEAVERRTYNDELYRAVEEHEFVLFYQPQIRITDRVVVGAEALIRWNHPQRGILSPGVFLSALEAGSLAATVGEWVVETACAQLAEWRAQLSHSFRMGVNLFSAQFEKNDLEVRIEDAIRRHRIPPAALELEITENIILDQDELILEPLQKMRQTGICVAFDDFGTGYASLSMLKNYPLTRIKIDQSFIRAMCSSRRDQATVAASIELARSHDLEVIAEGVETEAQLKKLAELGCDEAQGYLFGKPMPASEFLKSIGAK